MRAGVRSTSAQGPPLTRAYWSLVILLAISVLAAGGLSLSLAAAPSPSTGSVFAVSAVTLAAGLFLLTRVMAALDRGRRRPPSGPSQPRPVFDFSPSRLERPKRTTTGWPKSEAEDEMNSEESEPESERERWAEREAPRV